MLSFQRKLICFHYQRTGWNLIVEAINLNKCGQTTIMFPLLTFFRIRALNCAHAITISNYEQIKYTKFNANGFLQMYLFAKRHKRSFQFI